MRAWVEGVVLDVSDLDRSEAFWTGLLGLERIRRRDQYLYLSGLAQGMMLILQQVPDPKTAKNRMHVEVRAVDPQATIDWVLDNGGRLVGDHETDWYSLVVMADPDGNEFCVGR